MAQQGTQTINGVTVTNKNLIKTDNLQVQLAMMLEVMSDFSAKFDEVNRKFEATQDRINQVEEKQRQTAADVRALSKNVDRIDGEVQRMDTFFRKEIQEVNDLLQQQSKEHEELKKKVEDHAPRIAKLEVKVAENEEKFTKQLFKHETEIARLSREQKKQGEGLRDITERFERADIDGLRDQVNSQGEKLKEHAGLHVDHSRRLDDKDREVAAVAKELSEVRPYVDATFATKTYVQRLEKRLDLFVTKTYMEEKQQEFHEHIEGFVEEELQDQRSDIYDKMRVLEERILNELEGATRNSEVEMCADRIQELTRELGDLGSSVTKHNEEIERNASRILAMGSSMESVQNLRSGMDEINQRVGSMLRDLEDKVSRSIQSADSFAGGPLEGLQGALGDQVRAIQNRVEHELVPRPFLEDALMQLKRRFADLEWKFMRRRDDGGGDGDAEYNARLFNARSPFLQASRHPAADGLPKRPSSAIGSSSARPLSAQPSHRSGARPASAQVHRSVDAGVSGVDGVVVRAFESVEMRYALSQGRDISTKGSANAQRVFGAGVAGKGGAGGWGGEYGVPIPEDLHEVLEGVEGLPSPARAKPKRPTTAPVKRNDGENTPPTWMRAEFVPPRPGGEGGVGGGGGKPPPAPGGGGGQREELAPLHVLALD